MVEDDEAGIDLKLTWELGSLSLVSVFTGCSLNQISLGQC